MEATFKVWETNRNLYLKYFEDYSLDQLNKVPAGFSNNLIWNIGHVIIAQQGLLYKSCGLPGYVSLELFQLYKPGTKPTGITSEEEVAELKELLISLIAKTKKDFSEGVFQNFQERTTRTGFHLASIADAIAFNNYHEGLHLGYMMNIRKFI